MRAHEAKGAVANERRRVVETCGRAPGTHAPGLRHDVARAHGVGAAQQPFRIEIVRVHLVAISEELVESLRVRPAFRLAVPAQPPLTEQPGHIAGIVHALGERHVGCAQKIIVVVVETAGAVVQSRHERTARRPTHGGAGAELREAQPFAREPVDMRRRDLLLSPRTDFPDAQIVGEQDHDVRRHGCGRGAGRWAAGARAKREGAECNRGTGVARGA